MEWGKRVWVILFLSFIFLVGFYYIYFLRCENKYENAKYKYWSCHVEVDWKYIKENIYKRKVRCEEDYEISKYKNKQCFIELDWKYYNEEVYLKMITWSARK